MSCCTSDGMAGRTDDGNGAANATVDSKATLKLLRNKRFITTSGITYLDAGRLATVTQLMMIVAEPRTVGIVAKVPGSGGKQDHATMLRLQIPEESTWREELPRDVRQRAGDTRARHRSSVRQSRWSKREERGRLY